MSGWGEGAWGRGTWGEGETVPSSVVASGAVGSVIQNVSVTLTGVLCHPDIGGVDETNLPEIQEVHADGYAGNASPDRLIVLSGVVADGSVGTITYGGATVQLAGNEVYGYAGYVEVPLSSLEANGQVGNVLSGIEIQLTGSSLSASVGSVGLGARSAALTGVLGTGSAGNLTSVYWRIIDDSQTANWQNISNSQAANWEVVT